MAIYSLKSVIYSSCLRVGMSSFFIVNRRGPHYHSQEPVHICVRFLFKYRSKVTVLIPVADSILRRRNEVENRFTHGIKVILGRFTLLLKKLISNF